jgi:lysophospholipase L1-like esterase
MFECMILGDSIGVGISQRRPECVAYVKTGINTQKWIDYNITKDLASDTIIISLGSNDSDRIHTFKELMTLREVIEAKRVFWILPANKENVRDNIKIIAKNYNDITLDIPEVSKDKVHPTAKAYKILAGQTK